MVIRETVYVRSRNCRTVSITFRFFFLFHRDDRIRAHRWIFPYWMWTIGIRDSAIRSMNSSYRTYLRTNWSRAPWSAASKRLTVIEVTTLLYHWGDLIRGTYWRRRSQELDVSWLKDFALLQHRFFSIDDSGEISVSDLSKVNSSTVHLVAVATDSGVPPRQVRVHSHQQVQPPAWPWTLVLTHLFAFQASVPVIVHLPEAVVSSASHWVPQNTSFAILISFVSILGVLALIIVLLILYIQKKYAKFKFTVYRVFRTRTFSRFQLACVLAHTRDLWARTYTI